MRNSGICENRKLNINLRAVSNLILKNQKISGEIPWYNGGKTDPWNHVEAAMGLTTVGRFKEARQAFCWLKRKQKKK